MSDNFSDQYLILDRELHTSDEILQIAKLYIQKNVSYLEYIDYKIHDDFNEIIWQLRQLSWSTNTKLILNNNLNFAKKVDADGVFLEQNDLNLFIENICSCNKNIDISNFNFELVRQTLFMKERLYQEFLFGVHVHSQKQMVFAKKIGASYIKLGQNYEMLNEPYLKYKCIDNSLFLKK